MNFLAGIRLKNFCGYRNTKISFIDGKTEEIKRINVIFGPNGEGKSSLLEAIRLVSNPFVFKNKESEMMIRKLIYHPDYDPTYAEFFPSDNTMEVEGVFDCNGEFKNVFISNEGIERCDLEEKTRGYVYSVDADHPSHLIRFQVASDWADKFLEIAKIVYGYKCELTTSVNETLKNMDGTEENVVIYTDFVIHKNHTRVHYKRMSAGEKKIATLLSMLCDKYYMEAMDIILIDNVELHVYFLRHAAMIDKLLEVFPNKQFIITTHSGTMIDHIAKTYGQDKLYNLESLKGSKNRF